MNVTDCCLLLDYYTQGSVLQGPLLFVAYTCPSALQYSLACLSTSMLMTYIALSKSDINMPVDKLQNFLSTVHLWFSQNGFDINPQKSEVVLLSTSQQARALASP